MTESFTKPSGSYVEWSAIFAGAVLASAISIVLLTFGSAIGLAATSPLRGEGWTLPVGVLSSGVWILWAQITASIGGGYLAGRLRAPRTEAPDHEREVRDGVHGLLTWATATVAVFVAVSAASALAALVTTHADHADLTAQMLHAKKNAAVIFAFIAASISLVSATAAWWAAVKGGEHRDGSTDFSQHYSFRKG